jgi:hypothetical protein
MLSLAKCYFRNEGQSNDKGCDLELQLIHCTLKRVLDGY